MGKIVAIGGGELRLRETLTIDREILNLTGKSNPQLLFLPTASEDAEGYIATVQAIYSELGADVNSLKLITDEPTQTEIEDKILSSDAIYVGGGNTQKMMNIWREKGVDKVLKKAFEQGIVISGLSAGAICWFEFGSTDSPRFTNSEDTDFVLIQGLGFVKGLVSPHHIREPDRIAKIPDLIKESRSVGLGIDDNCAIEIVDDKYRILASKEGCGITRFYFNENNILKTNKYEAGEEWMEYSALLDIN
jgi:dipeptidase E